MLNGRIVKELQAGPKMIEESITGKIGSPSQTTFLGLKDFLDVKNNINHPLREILRRSFSNAP
jgi:hypothetical protein